MKFRHLILPCALAATVLVAHAVKPMNLHAGKGIKCHLVKVMDDQTQMAAFTYLVPEGWTSHSVFHWVAPGAYSANLSAATPDKQYTADQLMRLVYSWSLAKSFNGQIIGQKGFPIHHATDFLHVMLEQLKKQYNVDDVEVMDEVNGPLAQSQMAFGARQRASDPMTDHTPVNEVGFLQVKFVSDGVPMIASLGTTVSGENSVKHQPGRPDQESGEYGVLVVGPSTVIVHPESGDAAKEKSLQLISSSMAPNPAFISYWRKLNTHLAEVTIKANEMGQQWADLHWHERAMSQFRNEMDAKDAMSKLFCHYVQDEHDFKDKDGTMVTVPTMFESVFSDGNGNYMVSPEKGVSPPGGWQELPKYTFGN